MAKETRQEARLRRHARVRRKVSGTSSRPRLSVYRSLQHMYVQIIDDEKGHTLVSASTIDRGLRERMSALPAKERAKALGLAVAERARAQGIETVVFDRGGYPYHGQVKAVADGSREGGLVF